MRTRTPRPAAPAQRWSRRRGVMSVFALFAVAAFGVAYIRPRSASTTHAELMKSHSDLA